MSFVLFFQDRTTVLLVSSIFWNKKLNDCFNFIDWLLLHFMFCLAWCCLVQDPWVTLTKGDNHGLRFLSVTILNCKCPYNDSDLLSIKVPSTTLNLIILLGYMSFGIHYLKPKHFVLSEYLWVSSSILTYWVT